MDTLPIRDWKGALNRFTVQFEERFFNPLDRTRLHKNSDTPTPKHGSWLDMAEIELSALARDLPERVGERDDLTRHVAAWIQRRNRDCVKANWQFTAADARIKFRKIYPTFDG